MKKISFVLCFVLSFSICAQIEDFEHISFYKADSVAGSHHGADLQNVPKLSLLLTKDLETDVEKARSIFMWITKNISSDNTVLERNKRKRRQFRNDSVKLIEWNHHIRRKTLDRLLKKKKTVCTGYAYLLKEMCKYAGIKSVVVNGFSRTADTEHEELTYPNHSWNVVLLNDKWYLCDPTWATGMFDPNTFTFDFEYQEGFFLANPILFVKNHYPLDPKWTLLGDKTPTFEEFLEGPLLYNAAFDYGIVYQGSLKMNNTISKKKTISFQFDQLNPKKVESVHLVLSSKRKDNTIEPADLVIDADSISFNYQFLYKGYYDLHLMLNHEAVMTYTFHVKK